MEQSEYKTEETFDILLDAANELIHVRFNEDYSNARFKFKTVNAVKEEVPMSSHLRLQEGGPKNITREKVKINDRLVAKDRVYSSNDGTIMIEFFTSTINFHLLQEPGIANRIKNLITHGRTDQVLGVLRDHCESSGFNAELAPIFKNNTTCHVLNLEKQPD